MPATNAAAAFHLQNAVEVDVKYSGENSGGFVTNNVGARQIQIRTNAPPTKEIQDALRNLGFRWFKTKGIWARKNTCQAFMTLRHPEILIDLDPHLAWALEIMADAILRETEAA